MLARPHTLSIITTHQCTAACDHCCFSCTPEVTEAIPYERLTSLIDEARAVESIRVVVFTGGECFLLGGQLDKLIARATSYGFITRCVTNGYWANGESQALKRLTALVAAGLKEINFSTGTFHAKYVPVDRIVDGATVAVELGLTTLINIETFKESDFDINRVLENPKIKAFRASKKLIVQRSVWIENKGCSTLTHQPDHSRFRENLKGGCRTALNVIAVTPKQSAVACCGLHMEHIPSLHFANLQTQSLSEALKAAEDDFLKIWIHVDGPERILEFVKKYLPDYALPLHSVHPCETCLHMYKDERALAVIREHYHEVEAEVTAKYLAGLAMQEVGRRIHPRTEKTSNDAFGGTEPIPAKVFCDS